MTLVDIDQNMTAQENLSGSEIGGATNSVPQDFVERVALATERMKAEGIEIWRPSIDEELEDIFQVAIVGESVGCTNQQCNHNSHDPASPTIKLIPKTGKLLFLGEVQYSETTSYFYALLQNNSATYYEVVSEPFFWDKIFQVESIVVPDFLLARLGE